MRFSGRDSSPSLEEATADAQASAVPWTWTRIKKLLSDLWYANKENAELQNLLDAERERTEAALQRVAELEQRLAKDSHNSSKPPSSDPLFRKPTPAPKLSDGSPKKAPGGQPGHAGHTLARRALPDAVVECPLPPKCSCGLALVPELAAVRQVLDMPPPALLATDYRTYKAVCSCGLRHRSEFPSGVNAAVQYGPRITAIGAFLAQHHAVAYKRCAEVLTVLSGEPLSPGTVVSMAKRVADALEEAVEDIKDAVSQAAVVNVDETGMRRGGVLVWLHAATTPLLTWMAPHEKRGSAALSEFGVLDGFKGTLVHDGLASYRDFDVTHALCNAHHLRELLFVQEVLEQDWARELIDVLLLANEEARATGGLPLPEQRRQELRAQYDAILATGKALNPAAVPKPPSRRRLKQSVPCNLLRRLDEFADDVMRFTLDPAVPFTNNLAERAMRMPKVKQKVSGGFRTPRGVADYCVLRSYVATLAKQGRNVFDALVLAAQGNAPSALPGLATS